MLSVRDRFTCAYVVPGNLEASSCQHQSHGIGSSTATTALNNLNAVLVNKQASVYGRWLAFACEDTIKFLISVPSYASAYK